MIYYTFLLSLNRSLLYDMYLLWWNTRHLKCEGSEERCPPAIEWKKLCKLLHRYIMDILDIDETCQYIYLPVEKLHRQFVVFYCLISPCEKLKVYAETRPTKNNFHAHKIFESIQSNIFHLLRLYSYDWFDYLVDFSNSRINKIKMFQTRSKFLKGYSFHYIRSTWILLF